jgi:hypothetical protein
VTPLKKSFLAQVRGKVGDLVSMIFYAPKNIFNRVKVKTSSTILALAISGAAIGALVGLGYFGVGAAPGAVVGAFLGLSIGIAPYVGVAVIAIAGMVLGAFLGDEFSKRVFKSEKNYELSCKVTDKIYEEMKIDAKTANLMNCYLFNKAQHSNDKDRYLELIKNGITLSFDEKEKIEHKKLEMERIITILVKDLVQLKYKHSHSSPDEQAKIDNEISAIEHILKGLKTSIFIENKDNKYEDLSTKINAAVALDSAQIVAFKKQYDDITGSISNNKLHKPAPKLQALDLARAHRYKKLGVIKSRVKNKIHAKTKYIPDVEPSPPEIDVPPVARSSSISRLTSVKIKKD